MMTAFQIDNMAPRGLTCGMPALGLVAAHATQSPPRESGVARSFYYFQPLVCPVLIAVDAAHESESPNMLPCFSVDATTPTKQGA